MRGKGRKPKRRPLGEPVAPTTILLVDDHTMVRKGLRALLEAERDVSVIGEAQDGHQAIELAVELDPDVVVMDIAMPNLNGIDATIALRARAPRSRVVVLSAHGETPYVERVLSIGAVGFVLKHGALTDLLEAIREAQKGRSFVSAGVRRRVRASAREVSRRTGAGGDPAEPLSPREAQVLQRVAEGSGNKQIARDLEISVKTVEKHRQSLMRKLDLHGVADIVRYALAAGVIESGPTLGPE